MGNELSMRVEEPMRKREYAFYDGMDFLRFPLIWLKLLYRLVYNTAE